MNPDPQPHPVIEFGGNKYELKFRASDVIRLKKEHQIELHEVRTFIGAEALEKTLQTLQAAVRHQEDIPFEKLAELVEWQRMPEVSVAIQEAISKVSSQVIALKPRLDVIRRQTEELQAMNAPPQVPQVN